jgi:nucleotide-binding universal stress UspA family protein
MIALKNVLVAVDFGEASDGALLYGRALATSFGATLHVIHIAENMFLRPVVGDPRGLEEAAVRRLHARLTDEDRRLLRARVVVEMSDDPAEAIVRYSKASDIDLIVTGTHGRTGVAHALLGSIAEHVVRTASCPVLTVKRPEREFVVPDSDYCAVAVQRQP